MIWRGFFRKAKSHNNQRQIPISTRTKLQKSYHHKIITRTYIKASVSKRWIMKKMSKVFYETWKVKVKNSLRTNPWKLITSRIFQEPLTIQDQKEFKNRWSPCLLFISHRFTAATGQIIENNFCHPIQKALTRMRKRKIQKKGNCKVFCLICYHNNYIS